MSAKSRSLAACRLSSAAFSTVLVLLTVEAQGPDPEPRGSEFTSDANLLHFSIAASNSDMMVQVVVVGGNVAVVCGLCGCRVGGGSGWRNRWKGDEGRSVWPRSCTLYHDKGRTEWSERDKQGSAVLIGRSHPGPGSCLNVCRPSVRGSIIKGRAVPLQRSVGWHTSHVP